MAKVELKQQNLQLTKLAKKYKYNSKRMAKTLILCYN